MEAVLINSLPPSFPLSDLEVAVWWVAVIALLSFTIPMFLSGDHEDDS